MLLYQFKFAAGRQNSFRDFADGYRLLVAPVLIPDLDEPDSSRSAPATLRRRASA